mmetsp:Transcript_6392/g.17055  ORF Transcript_6392/g.17055 Transcript_6392/m.17055 type:complete len:276 (+) Transcript_6392:805-1632(+)
MPGNQKGSPSHPLLLPPCFFRAGGWFGCGRGGTPFAATSPLPLRFSSLRRCWPCRSCHQAMVLLARAGIEPFSSAVPNSSDRKASVKPPLSAPVEEETMVRSHSDCATALLAALRTRLAAAIGEDHSGALPTKGLSRASVADNLSEGLYAIKLHKSSQPAPLSRSRTSKPSATSGFMPPFLASSCLRQARRSQFRVASFLLKLMRLLSDRRLGNTICISVTPQEYMSNLSGPSMRHSTGDKKAATGAGGGRGVCMLMTYCWGGAYLGSSRYSLGT